MMRAEAWTASRDVADAGRVRAWRARARRCRRAGRSAADAPKTPTFTKDIAPIFQEKCEACHRPDSIAPMSLMTYAEARPWARSIKARVADRADAAVADRSRRSASRSSRTIARSPTSRSTTILRWVDAGAPQGDPKDMPAAKQWPDDQGWNFAALFGQKEPDLIIKSYDFTMPAVSQDAWDKRVTPSGITEPRWVRAIEIRPETIKGRKITHHAIAYLEQNEPGAPAGRLACRRRSWNGRSASRAR